MLNLIKTEPVAVSSAIRLTLLTAIAYGMHLTDTQLVATMAAVEAIFALFSRQSVTPTAKFNAPKRN